MALTLAPLKEAAAELASVPTACGQPCIVRGIIRAGLQQWTVEELRERHGELQVRVEVASWSGDRISDAARRHELEIRTLPLATFLDTLSAPPSSSIAYRGSAELGLREAPLLDTFPLPYRVGGSPPLVHISRPPVSSGLHIDRFDGFFFQLLGRKRFVLFAPTYGHSLAQRIWHCDADPDRPDYVQFPALSHVTGFEAILEPGDMLYFPVGWFHKVSYLSAPAISATIFRQVPEERATPASVAHAQAMSHR